MRAYLTRDVGYYLATTFLALLIFLVTCGEGILGPTNLQWLFDGDLLTHWIGWHYFRSTPFLQWPLGANPDYGVGLQNTIVFSDSIPLLAVLFRTVSPGLPVLFQYTGIWLAFCFVMQALVAFEVLRCLRVPSPAALVGSLFFVLAPPFLVRVSGHSALAGQWLILLAIFCLFSRKFRAVTWVCLAVVSALVHAYLLAMVLALWLADLVAKTASKTIGVRLAAACLVGQGLLVFLLMWSVGYFSFWPAPEGGFGLYKINILSPFSPNHFSRFMPDLVFGPQVFEGTAYFGIGTLIVIVLAVAARLSGTSPVLDRATRWVVVALCVGLTAFALSHRLAFGRYEWVLFDLPASLASLTSAFRASARFFWPVYYIVIFLSVSVLARRAGGRVAAAILAAALGIQLFDFWPALAGTREHLATVRAEPSSVLASPVWKEIPRRYRNLVVVMPANQQERWSVFAYYAAINRMSVNTGYFARTNGTALAEQRRQIWETVLNSAYRPDTAYIFEDPLLWAIAFDKQPGQPYRMFEVDGVKILLPHFSGCAECGELVDAGKPPPLGKDGRFKGVTATFMDWSGDEGTHRWSIGKSNRLLLRLEPTAQAQDVCLDIDYLSLGKQTVTVTMDQKTLGAFELTGREKLQLNVGPAGRWIDLTFSYSNPHSPGASDPRLLAFAIRGISARKCDEAR